MVNSRMLISLEEVVKTYRFGHETITALNKVSLKIDKGEVVAIVGPSGSGKTTLSQVIGGLLTPNSGTVSIDGSLLEKQNDKKLSKYRNEKVGFVLQNFGLIPYYSALENVVGPLVVRGVAAKARNQRASDLLRRVGLAERIHQNVTQHSRGERQRVAIARALIAHPEIIIADEPTGNLDSVHGQEVMTILENLARENDATIVMVTHDLSLAKRANRIIAIRDGKIEKEVMTNARR